MTSERRPIMLQRVSFAVIVALLASTLSFLPSTCVAAAEDRWHDDGGQLDGPYGDGGDDDRFASDDIMEHEQYSERLQQQLESLRKEHDEIFGKGDNDKDGFLSPQEYLKLHRDAEDDQGSYDQEELEQGFADLDQDGSTLVSLEEWRRPFEQHIDSWLQMADTEAQQEAQIAHYKDVFNQMDLNGDGELDEDELQREMDSLQAQRRAAQLDEGSVDGDDGYTITQLSGVDMLAMMDSDMSGKVSFEEYLLGGEQPHDDDRDHGVV